MAKNLFSNEQLLVAWRTVAGSDPRGTRRDVVNLILEAIGQDPENEVAYRKMYNNVTQRVKLLTKRNAEVGGSLVFEPLAPGPRGRRVDSEEIMRLAALMTAGEPVVAGK